MVPPAIPPALTLFDSDVGTTATYVVMGTPRGGTSMVAGLLRMAGIWMGDDVNAANNEDNDFLIHGGLRAFHSKERRPVLIARYRQLLQNRNARHQTWGWKDPISSMYVGDLLEDLRSPRFIVIVRDAAAASFRELAVNRDRATRKDNDPSDFLRRRINDKLMLQRLAFDVVFAARKPTLIISYERFLRHADVGIDLLLGFLGRRKLLADAGMAERLLHYVTPERNTGSIDLQKGALKTGHKRNGKDDSMTGNLKLTEVSGDSLRVVRVDKEGSEKKLTLVGKFRKDRKRVPPSIADKLSESEQKEVQRLLDQYHG